MTEEPGKEMIISPCAGCEGCAHKNKVSVRINAEELIEAEEHFKKGSRLYSYGKMDEAIEELKKSLAIDPDNTEAHLILGDIAERRMDYEEAVKEYEEVLRIDPSDKFTKFKLETALRQKKK